MQFTMVDGGVAFIAVISAILAYSRGLTREILAIGGWLVAAVAAAFLTPVVEPLIREIPGVGPFLASSCVLSVIAAFTLVMALGLLVMAVFTPVISGLVLDSAIGPLDRILGFVFGVARAAFLVAVAYILYEELAGGQESWEPLATAQVKPYLDEISRILREAMPTELPPYVTERIDAMMAPCQGEGLDTGTVAPLDGGADAPADSAADGYGIAAPADSTAN
ncbi:CvpA family protein [Paralimibaculum aggregatum]|uniref:CvpA family protein n=1 Tax=Paralimibaculum aggregatum TaxID=3036245 RepID=A0ABQ6LCV1_9RHOB|nr:CvpA family protein [Limibaculum sp. NKW23]GMG81198.1 CvpA family protein [Limibaculum sp. NKW23]